MAKSKIVKNGQLYAGISDFTTNLNIPDVHLQTQHHLAIHEKATVVSGLLLKRCRHVV